MPSRACRRLLCTVVLAAIAQAWVCPSVWAQPATARQPGRPGAWEPYRPVIIGGILALLVLQAGLLAALLGQRSRRRQSDGRYDAIVTAVPDLMFLQTMDGVYPRLSRA